MLNEQTIEKLHSMRFSTLANEYRRQMESPDTASLNFEERFAMLVE